MCQYGTADGELSSHVEFATQKPAPLTCLLQKLVSINGFKACEQLAMFFLIYLCPSPGKQQIKRYEKPPVHFSGNTDHWMVIRSVCVECNRFDPHPDCTGGNITFVWNNTKSIDFNLSHIHGPFYQQGYSSPL